MLNEMDTFLDAVVAALDAALPVGVQVVAYYRQQTARRVATPGVLVELESLAEGEDKGDERLPLACRVTAFCNLSTQTPDEEREIRKFAAEVFRLVRRNKFGLGGRVSFPADIDIGPATLRDDKAGVLSWFVSWEQTLYIGTSVWDAEGVLPDTVYLGQAPEIGTGYEADYEQVVPDPGEG